MHTPFALWEDVPGRHAARPGALIRHPEAVPARLAVAPGRGWRDLDLLDHGEGGVCVEGRLGYLPGTVLEVSVEACGRDLSYRGQVLWRRRLGGGFQFALAFSSPDQAFQARMVEQMCYIEAYRLRSARDGESLSPDEAAARWIAAFSGDFPQLGAPRRNGGEPHA